MVDTPPAELTARLRALPADRLTVIVRRVLDAPDARVDGQWSVDPIGVSYGRGTIGIFRLSGEARADDGPWSWSVVVKVLSSVEDEHGSGSAAREIAAYRSGYLDGLPGGVRSARCYAIEERPGDEVWLWLEDFALAPHPPWPHDYFAIAARHLGRFNGASLVNGIPDWDWVTTDYVRDEIRARDTGASFRLLAADREHPVLRAICPPEVVDPLLNMWDRSEALFDAAGALPRVLGHMDSHTRNLFPVIRDGRYIETVAIDWASFGTGPVGQDAGTLIGSEVAWLRIEPSAAEAVEPSVFEAYVAGLEDAGWSPDTDAVRLGFLTVNAAYAMKMVIFGVDYALNPPSRSFYERFMGAGPDDIARRMAGALRYFVPRIEEAVALAKGRD